MQSIRTLSQSTSRIAAIGRTQVRSNGIPRQLSQAACIQQQTRNIGHAGGRGKEEGDMGGPAGQEVYPASNEQHRKYKTITAAGVVAALGIMYMMKGDKNEGKST